MLSTRQGRCGEYSVLALHTLRALGYTARWVVDRDDHVRRHSALAGVQWRIYRIFCCDTYRYGLKCEWAVDGYT
jgi:transglutaminase-like putative cysteine protease